MTEKRIVLTTVGSKEEAQKIAYSLVNQHIAACVNIIGPIESVYRWHEKVETAVEYQLVIKTMAGSLDALQQAIQQMHSYDLPEFIVLTIEAGSQQYLEWIEGCVR